MEQTETMDPTFTRDVLSLMNKFESTHLRVEQTWKMNDATVKEYQERTKKFQAGLDAHTLQIDEMFEEQRTSIQARNSEISALKAEFQGICEKWEQENQALKSEVRQLQQQALSNARRGSARQTQESGGQETPGDDSVGAAERRRIAELESSLREQQQLIEKLTKENVAMGKRAVRDPPSQSPSIEEVEYERKIRELENKANGLADLNNAQDKEVKELREANQLLSDKVKELEAERKRKVTQGNSTEGDNSQSSPTRGNAGSRGNSTFRSNKRQNSASGPAPPQGALFTERPPGRLVDLPIQIERANTDRNGAGDLTSPPQSPAFDSSGQASNQSPQYQQPVSDPTPPTSQFQYDDGGLGGFHHIQTPNAHAEGLPFENQPDNDVEMFGTSPRISPQAMPPTTNYNLSDPVISTSDPIPSAVPLQPHLTNSIGGAQFSSTPTWNVLGSSAVPLQPHLTNSIGGAQFSSTPTWNVLGSGGMGFGSSYDQLNMAQGSQVNTANTEADNSSQRSSKSFLADGKSKLKAFFGVKKDGDAPQVRRKSSKHKMARSVY
ncbi:hypothetical protein DFH27DRAFT_223169 [Peziza echinospora]|nr:hypothetical protein DFH27DRAFT_223169 [Peziza echinospora]